MLCIGDREMEKRERKRDGIDVEMEGLKRRAVE
jgi:hypothetical protein